MKKKTRKQQLQKRGGIKGGYGYFGCHEMIREMLWRVDPSKTKKDLRKKNPWIEINSRFYVQISAWYSDSESRISFKALLY